MILHPSIRELDTMYKVYQRDFMKGFRIARVATFSKKQELILKAIDRRFMKIQCT